MFRGPLLIVFLINIRTSLGMIDALYHTAQEVWKLNTVLDNMELNISHNARADEQSSDIVMIQKMKKQVDKIHEHLNQLEKFVGPKEIQDAIKSWQLDALTMMDIDKIEIFMLSIDEDYKLFYQAINASGYPSDPSKAPLRELFQVVEDYIEIIRGIVTHGERSQSIHQNLVAAIVSFTAINKAEICGAPRIISNTFIQLFRMIIIAEMKTNTMLAYRNFLGYMKNRKKKWQRFSSSAKEKLEEQFTIYVDMFSSNISVMDTVYNRACDPLDGNWIRDESFYEIEQTFQATLFNYYPKICPYQSCNTVSTRDRSECAPSFAGVSDVRSRADTVGECAYLSNITACILYVDSEELGFLGRNSTCPEDNGRVFKSRMGADRTYAACVCNSYSSHNKISLLMIESDVKSNRVITGLRFVRKNQILWIQPREGTLESNGYINPYSQRWIPIPGNVNSTLIEPINKENRVFFLDDLVLPATFVLTGVKFNKVTRESVSGYAIEIFGNHFNYGCGTLSLGETFRQSRKGSNDESGKGLSFKAVSSVFTTLLHRLTPSDTKYVSLERSTLEDDFGQSTLPLFDAVPITFRVPSALGGVGIVHKGVEGYAGLISLRVYGINYEGYFNKFKKFRIINPNRPKLR